MEGDKQVAPRCVLLCWIEQLALSNLPEYVDKQHWGTTVHMSDFCTRPTQRFISGYILQSNMPMTCVAYGCNNHFVRGCGKQFFRFPMKDPERLSKWVAAIRRKNWKPSASSRICSEHFTDKDYMLRPGAMVPRLRLDAVPTIFNGFPKHLKERLERKKKKKIDEVVVVSNSLETQLSDQTYIDKKEVKMANNIWEISEGTTGMDSTTESSLPAIAVPGTVTAENQENQKKAVTSCKETIKMKTCVVHGCRNTIFKACKKKFFRFPLNDPELLSKWIVAVHRKYWKPSTSSRICSDHFTDKDYLLCPDAKDPQLRHDAVPSIFNRDPKWKHPISNTTEDQTEQKEGHTETSNNNALPEISTESFVDELEEIRKNVLSSGQMQQVKHGPVEKDLPTTCVVYGCNNTFIKGCRKHFFRFPLKNPEQLYKWIQAVRTTQWKPSAFSRICSDHFKDKDYIFQPGIKVPRLHANAVPFACKEKRSTSNNLRTESVRSEQFATTHRPADHTYSALLNAVVIPHCKPDTMKLKKKVRTLQRQIQRQRHTIKKLSEIIAQLRKNKDFCSISSLVV
ncbi:uncharacterized protein [Pyxicephalus adspersus]|uniref:uncharacterized protein isoform X2 n=1 Tax=Pyxicephalus adspersus TaxID=30357 RepID=UPI003B5A5086